MTPTPAPGCPVPRRPRRQRRRRSRAGAQALLILLLGLRSGEELCAKTRDEPQAEVQRAPALFPPVLFYGNTLYASGNPPLVAPPQRRPPAEGPNLVPLPLPDYAPSPAGLKAAGWTFGVIGGAATITGLALIPFRPEGLPLATGVVPILAVGAAALLTGRVLFALAAERRGGLNP